MYDPAGSDSNREWIEVYNSGAASIDLAGLFFLSDGLSSSKHSLAAQTSSVIPAGGYAVIVQTVDGFKADYPNYSGLIFDSSWTGLSASSGKTLAIITSASSVLDQVTYDPSIGGANDGNSLQKNSAGSWVVAQPTPGAATAAPGSEPSTETSSETGGDTTTTGDTRTGGSTAQSSGGSTSATPTQTKTAAVASPRIQAVFTVPKNAVTGIPVPISLKILSFGEPRAYGLTHIAFGNGDARGGKSEESFAYTYEFPGTYVVSLEYRSNVYMKEPEITARVTIVVSDSSVAISRVNPNGSIELTNSSKADADLSGWILQTLDVEHPIQFHIPVGTIILAGKSILFSARLTEIPIGTRSLALALPSGIVSALYGEQTEKLITTVASHSVVTAPVVQKIKSETVETPAPEIIETNLAASVVGAETGKRSVIPFVVGLLGVIIAAGVALWKFDMFPQETKKITEEKISEPETPIDTNTVRIVEE